MSQTDRTLVEHDPAEFNLELLSILQQGLMEKLVQTNRELVKRYSFMVEAGANIPGTAEPLSVLAEGVERLRRIDAILEGELERKLRFRESHSHNGGTAT